MQHKYQATKQSTVVGHIFTLEKMQLKDAAPYHLMFFTGDPEQIAN